MKMDELLNDKRFKDRPATRGKRPRPWLTENSTDSDTETDAEQVQKLEPLPEHQLVDNLVDKLEQQPSQEVGQQEVQKLDQKPDLIAASKDGQNAFVFEVKNQTESGSETGSKTIIETGSNNAKEVVEYRPDMVQMLRLRDIKRINGAMLDLLQELFKRTLITHSTETDFVQMAEIADFTGHKIETLRTAAKRAISAGFIEKIDVRQGVGGYTRYRFKNDVYQHFMKTHIKTGSK